MEEAEKMIENYTEYMTLSVLPEAIFQQCSSNTGAALLKKGYAYLQNREEEKAAECYREAAEKGEADACFALSVCYEYGIGVQADLKQADVMFEKAIGLKKQSICDLMGVGGCSGSREESNVQTFEDERKELTNKENQILVKTSVQKKNSCVMSANFTDLLFPPFNLDRKKQLSAIERIVFGKNINDKALSGFYYYKDISASGNGSVIGWVEDTTLHIEANGKVTAPVDCSDLFRNMNIESFEWNDAFDTGEVTSMSHMFGGCKNLRELDLSGFDTQQVMDMRNMFEGCENLEKLELSGFDTRNVRNLSGMFVRCENLRELDLSGFNTGNATDVSWMFLECKNLTNLDLSGFDTGKVTDMRSMFSRCQNLAELELSGFDTGNVRNMSWMFSGCESLRGLELGGFDTGKVIDMSYMFFKCKNLVKLNLSGFDTKNIKNMSSMFSGCESLRGLELSGFDTGKVMDMSYMFSGCKNLTESDIRGLNIVGVKEKIFDGCDSLSEKDKKRILLLGH